VWSCSPDEFLDCKDPEESSGEELEEGPQDGVCSKVGWDEPNQGIACHLICWLV